MARLVQEAFKGPPQPTSLTVAVVTLLYTVVFFPIFLSSLLVWLPFRIIIIALVRQIHPNLELAGKGVTALLGIRSTRGRPDGNLVFHLICEGSFSLDKLRDQFHHNVLNFQDKKGDKIYRHLRFFFKPICQVLFWQEDDNFDLKNHIRFYDLNEPGLALPKDAVTEDDLMRVSGQLVGRSYAAGRSPWELLLIPNFKGKSVEDMRVITLRVHHGIADGLSAVSLIHRLFGASAPAPLAKFPQLTLKDKVLQTIYVTLRTPHELARFAADFTDDFHSWKLPAKSYSDDHVSLCSDPIPWSKIKRIMKKYEVNSNAAVYSVIVGALVRMMKQVGQEVPYKISCLTSYPLPNHPGGLCNHVSYSCFQFNPHIHKGSALVQRVGSQVKAANYLNPLALVMHRMSTLQSLFPVFIAKSLLVTPATFTFTHFPGPLKVLHDSKFASLLDIIPVLDSCGIGSVAMAVSAAGNLRIGLTVNKAVLPSENDHLSGSFAGCINDELESIF